MRSRLKQVILIFINGIACSWYEKLPLNKAIKHGYCATFLLEI